MLPDMDLTSCPGMAVPAEVMHHVVRVESSYNRYAIGVVGGRLVRQPKSLPEALATVRMLETKGYNFSLGLAQVNRYNLAKYGLGSYERAFEACPNLQAGSRILAECYGRSGGNWGKSFSCYYSGDFQTGFRHGYVDKIYASMRRHIPAVPSPGDVGVAAIEVVAPSATVSATAGQSLHASAQPVSRVIAEQYSRQPVGNGNAPVEIAPTTSLGQAPATHVDVPADAANIEWVAPPRAAEMAVRRSASSEPIDPGARPPDVDPSAVVRLADLQRPQQVSQAVAGDAPGVGNKVVDDAFVF